MRRITVKSLLVVLVALAFAPAAAAFGVAGFEVDLGPAEPLLQDDARDESAPAEDSPDEAPPAEGSEGEAPPREDTSLIAPVVSTLHLLDEVVPVSALVDVDAVLDELPAALPEPAPSAAPREAHVARATHVAPAVAPDPPAALPMRPDVALLAVAAATAAVPAAAAYPWSRLRRLGFLAFLYTRIAKERLLDHDGRERLLAQVRLHPGAPVSELARAASIPRNTAVYHLGRLEKEGLVSSMRTGRSRLYFAPGGLERREHAPAIQALRHPVSRDMAARIGAEPGLDQSALCDRLGVAPSLAHWHATRLVSAGVVTRERDGRRVRYYPGEAFGELDRA